MYRAAYGFLPWVPWVPWEHRPKVNPKTRKCLENVFDWLGREYPAIDWLLMTNDDFADRFLRPLREKTRQVKDTSELFVRSLQLLELIGSVKLGREK